SSVPQLRRPSHIAARTPHSHQHAVRFRGSNDEEMTQAKSPFITALYDGCQ
ncbi:hypothetical protein M9458_005600, partial [Cirrhinus mrigala]